MMQNLGTLGGADSYAYGINDSGQVVGVAWNSNQYEHAFLLSAAAGARAIFAARGSRVSGCGMGRGMQRRIADTVWRCR